MKRNEYITAARTLLNIPNSNQVIDDAIVDGALNSSIEEFSRDVPLSLVDEQIGQSEYRLPFPSRWKDELSVLKSMKLFGDTLPIIIDENGWQLVRVDETKRSVSNILASATSVTLSPVSEAKYFKPHSLVIVGSTATPNTYEYNWVVSASSTTGIVVLLNAIASAYTTAYIAKAKHIYISALTPGTTDVMELHYSAQRNIGDDETGYGDEIESSGKVEAFKHLSAAKTAEAVAAEFAKNQPNNQLLEAQIGTTNVEHWLNIAEKQRDAYKRMIGKAVAGEEKKATALLGSFQSQSIGGRPLIWQNEYVEDENYLYR